METGSPIDGLQDGTPSQGSRKRKAPSSGSRGVASLTPDQLAKKRANDREAQRAIRERTKQTIDTLEAKIKDLTSQQPYQELQAIVRQKDAIQAENEEMRRRMASIMGLIQPIIGAQGLTGTYHAASVEANTDHVRSSFRSSPQRSSSSKCERISARALPQRPAAILPSRSAISAIWRSTSSRRQKLVRIKRRTRASARQRATRSRN